MSASNCTVRGRDPEGQGQRGIGAVRLRLTAPYAGPFKLILACNRASTGL